VTPDLAPPPDLTQPDLATLVDLSTLPAPPKMCPNGEGDCLGACGPMANGCTCTPQQICAPTCLNDQDCVKVAPHLMKCKMPEMFCIPM
jgi:hypothetical protein